MAFSTYKLIGTTPQWGISAEELTTTGLLVQTLDWDLQADKQEFTDTQGNVCGARLYNQRMSLSVNGLMALDSETHVRMGDILTLANAIPDVWIGGAPDATTILVEGVKQSFSGTAAVSEDITATVYPYAA